MKPLQQMNSHTIEFHPQPQKLAVHFKYIVPCESSAEEDSKDSKVRTTYLMNSAM